MTLVVIHHSAIQKCLIAYADSRITDKGVITEAAGKLFTLPITIYNNNSRPIYRRTFGFAFAGSSLVAHSVFSFSVSALQTMRMDIGGKLPTLEDIAKFIALLAKEYIQEIGESRGISARAEISIFGHCPQSEKRRLFKAAPEFLPNQFNMTFGELDISTPGVAHFLGDTNAANAYIKLNAEGGRDPGETLQALIKMDEYPTIGGSVQVLKVDEKGARHLPTLHKGENGAYLQLLGKKIEDFGPLGSCHFRNEAWGVLD